MDDLGDDDVDDVICVRGEWCVPLVEPGADLACHSIVRRPAGVLAPIAEDGPGELRDGHYKAACSDTEAGDYERIVLAWPLIAHITGVQGAFYLGLQTGAKVSGEDCGGGTGRVFNRIGH